MYLQLNKSYFWEKSHKVHFKELLVFIESHLYKYLMYISHSTDNSNSVLKKFGEFYTHLENNNESSI